MDVLAVDDSLLDCEWRTEVLAVDDSRGAAQRRLGWAAAGDGEDDSEEHRK